MNEAAALLERAERGTRRGPDLVWAAAQRRHRPHSLLVGAALVLFVTVAVAALSLALGHGTNSEAPTATTPPVPPTEVTAEASGDQISTSVAITGPALEPGSTVRAHATLTNVSTEPLTVNIDPEDLMRIRWEVMPTRLLEAAHDLGITATDAGAVSFRAPQRATFKTPEERAAPPPSVTLGPGESTTFDAVVDIDDRVRTGSVTFLFTPRVVVAPPPDSSPGTTAFRQSPGSSLEVPLTVLRSTNGTVTEADAEVLAFEHPMVEQWLHSSPGGWPGMTIPGLMNFTGTYPTADGWHVIVGIQSEDATGDPADNVRDLGLCGFIIDVDRQGTVTIDYMNLGPGS